MALAASPSLNTHNAVALAEDAELDGLSNTPFETPVDILLPVHTTEVGLWLREQERVDSSIKVGVSGCSGVPCYHDNGAHWTVFGQESGRLSAASVSI